MKKNILCGFLGLAILCVIVCAGIRLGEWYLYTNGWSGKYNNTAPKEGQIRVVCVGDSITYGHSVANWEENNYPVVLQRLLGEDYHVANYGSSGACVNPNGDAPYTKRRAYQRSLDYEADILIFMLGTNDTKPQNWTDAETFFADYKVLLDSYMQGEKMPKVYIGLCAKAYEWEDDADGIAEYDIQPEIVAKIGEIIRENVSTLDYEVEILDVYTLTQAHPEWFSRDGIHPDQDGAKALAELAAAAILQEG